MYGSVFKRPSAMIALVLQFQISSGFWMALDEPSTSRKTILCCSNFLRMDSEGRGHRGSRNQRAWDRPH
ncbi:hypothetical protein NECAME_16434 [Necator americanus]|uniref:Uncharacterized protein n=1 Tax=Necator americanus TaxID=51031 RepID=W2TXB3_NECAM|nr:hypothetical protein NECAME_16434 [Necator americanus]ETN86274.1 hypothetical protein NECAME_16434 [Necator americanus]